MIESVAASAPFTPPDTGASRKLIPPALRRSANRTLAAGDIVEKSMQMQPGAIAAAAPSFPNSTSSTSSVAVTFRSTKSACNAAAAGDSTPTAPSASIWLRISLRRTKTLTAWPAPVRCRIIGLPIFPAPMKPIFVRASVTRTFPQTVAESPSQDGPAEIGQHPCQEPKKASSRNAIQRTMVPGQA